MYFLSQAGKIPKNYLDTLLQLLLRKCVHNHNNDNKVR